MLGAIANTCNDKVLSGILYNVKTIMLLIQIIVPILLIVWSGYEFFKLMMNPDEKSGTKKIVNKFIAAAIVFFIPMFLNLVFSLVGDNTNFSSCWNNASKPTPSSSYIPIDSNTNKQKIVPDTN